MSKAFIEVNFNSYREFYISSLPGGKMDSALKGFVFRGESKSNYRLLPSALRKNEKFERMVASLTEDYEINLDLNLEYDQIIAECILLQQFYTSVNNQGLPVPELSCFLDTHREKGEVVSEQLKKIIEESVFWPPQKLWPVMALAQHYGVPTRFLDWTYDKSVAAYFAMSGFFSHGSKERDSHIVIWAINSSYFSGVDNGFKFIVPTYYNNPNLCGQQGILSCLEAITYNVFNERKLKKTQIIPLDHFFLNAPDDLPTCLYRFKISTNDIVNDFKMIDKLGYSANKLFPGYAGAYKYLEDCKNVFEFKSNNSK